MIKFALIIWIAGQASTPLKVDSYEKETRCVEIGQKWEKADSWHRFTCLPVERE